MHVEKYTLKVVERVFMLSRFKSSCWKNTGSCFSLKETSGLDTQTCTVTSGGESPRSYCLSVEASVNKGRGCGATQVQGEGTDASMAFHSRRHLSVLSGKTIRFFYNKQKSGVNL